MIGQKKYGLFGQFAERSFRHRLIRWLFGRVFRSVDGNFVGDLTSGTIHRILVLRPNHRLGNLVLLTPLISELERIFPGAEIDIVGAGPAASEIFAGFPSVRRVYMLPRFMIRHLVRTVGMIADVWQARYDLAIDASRNSNSSRLMLALASSRHRIGIPDPTNATWAQVMSSAPRHLGALPIFMVRQALARGQDVDESTYPTVNIRLAPEERRAASQTLQTILRTDFETRSRVILGVFANATGAKTYDESWWLQLLAAITAGYSGLAVIELIAADGVSRLGDRFPSYYSSSPRQLASVISHMTCFVSGDCGVMHLACASGTPTIGLFSVSNPSKYAPRGHLSRAVLTQNKTPEEIAQAVIEVLKAVSRRRNAPLDIAPLATQGPGNCDRVAFRFPSPVAHT